MPRYTCPQGGTVSGSQCLGGGTSWTYYIHLGGKQIAETGAGVTQYVHTDALGSPVAHSNAAGGILNRSRYEPYGYVAQGSKPSPATSVIGFTGHVQDAETDLVYMQQRYYDPIAGRFLSVDPVVTDASTGSSFHRYEYGNSNPYRFTDPTGMQSEKTGSRLRGCDDGGSSCRSSAGIGGPAAPAGGIVPVLMLTPMGPVPVGVVGLPTAGGVPPALPGSALPSLDNLTLPPFTAAVVTLVRAVAILSAGANGEGGETRAKPPSNSKPIDETDWSGDHTGIKGQSGAGPKDNVRITPPGEVWVQRPGGGWEHTGNANDMIGGSEASGRRGKDREPPWKRDRGNKGKGG